MAIEIDDLITQEGDINVLDRVGGRINVTIEDVDLTGQNLFFEAGEVSLALTPSGTAQYFDLTPETLEILSDNRTTRFAVINKTPTPDEVLWEGFIFIRSVS